MVRLRFYAALRDAAGRDEIRLKLNRSCPVEALVHSLHERHPRLAAILEREKTLISVNEEMARPDTVVKDGDEIAFMPPFSGGALHAAPPHARRGGHAGRADLPRRRAGRSVQRAESLPPARIQEADFSMEAEISRVKRKSKRTGAVAVFVGTARDFSKGHEVLSVRLEQYAGMAEKKIREVRETALKKFPVIEVSIVHRTGELSIGDNIVMIVVGSEHRAEAFEACRWCIDELKRTVPLWKKERTPGGEIWVEDRP
jgi:molybdopterin synthase catalytic subunit